MEPPKKLIFQEETFQVQRIKKTNSEKTAYLSGNPTF